MIRAFIVKLLACVWASTLVGMASAGITVNVDVKDGESIAGEKTFKVTVISDNLVTKVEFYVGDDLRAEDDSTPYEFKLDTLAEKEGDLKVRFVAYTSEAESAAKTLNLKVENGLGKDADWHVDRGREALAESKWDDAIRSARTALKIKPGFNPARLVMARAYLGKSVLDQAQKFAEDVLASEANNATARDLLAAINLQKAFNTFSRGTGDRDATLKVIGDALKEAVKNRKAVLEAQLDSFGAVTDANRLQYADLAIRAQRYSLAIDQLLPLFRKDTRQPDVANRLLYAQMRTARMRDAFVTLQEYLKGNMVDGYGSALVAILNLQAGDAQKSLDAEKEALLSDPESLGVRTAQAYLALKRGATGALSKIAGQLEQTEGQRPEVLYYLSTVNYQLGNLDEAARLFQRCVLADPVCYDMYIERANEAIAVSLRGTPETDDEARKADRKYQQKVARSFFEAALEARPESFEALTGIALLTLVEGNKPEGLRLAQTAVKAGPEYAAGWYALACALGETNKGSEGMAAMTNAGKWDQPNLQGMAIPKPVEAWRYFARHGRTPLIAPPK
ncbi:MAG TPA: tetratricopeptide repeat protein [Fimbriimonadaceae bacterium]|nr:tetratricopeptide repeat protein [Fimbriimonadaceae bacterium]HRJ95268.1 tetratricopeptide repeat protein [Fimbriimonadaceae bacterium]